MSRIQKTGWLYKTLYKPFFNKKAITTKTKIRIHELVLIPILKHGSESWVLTKKLKQKLNACEMKVLRKIAGVTKIDKIRSDIIRKDLKIISVVQRIERQELRWFGHMVRMDEKRVVKEIWEMRMTGKKRKGRPRRKWNTEVAEALQTRGLTWTQARREAANSKWKKIVTSTTMVDEEADK